MHTHIYTQTVSDSFNFHAMTMNLDLVAGRIQHEKKINKNETNKTTEKKRIFLVSFWPMWTCARVEMYACTRSKKKDTKPMLNQFVFACSLYDHPSAKVSAVHFFYGKGLCAFDAGGLSQNSIAFLAITN